MPYDEKKSINRNGKIYYWNNEKKKVIEASINEYDIQNCPVDVISDLLSLIEPEAD